MGSGSSSPSGGFDSMSGGMSGDQMAAVAPGLTNAMGPVPQTGLDGTTTEQEYGKTASWANTPREPGESRSTINRRIPMGRSGIFSMKLTSHIRVRDPAAAKRLAEVERIAHIAKVKDAVSEYGEGPKARGFLTLISGPRDAQGRFSEKAWDIFEAIPGQSRTDAAEARLVAEGERLTEGEARAKRKEASEARLQLFNMQQYGFASENGGPEKDVIYDAIDMPASMGYGSKLSPSIGNSWVVTADKEFKTPNKANAVLIDGAAGSNMLTNGTFLVKGGSTYDPDATLSGTWFGANPDAQGVGSVSKEQMSTALTLAHEDWVDPKRRWEAAQDLKAWGLRSLD